MIVWKKDEGARHEACVPLPPLPDFSGIERFLRAKLDAFLAAGGQLPEDPEPGESAIARAAAEANESMGHGWAKGRGFWGRGFTEPA